MHVHKDFPFLIIEDNGTPLRESIQAETLKEGIGLTVTGKLFLAGLAAWLVGRASKLKVRGTRREIGAIAGALRSSKRFQDELKKNGATVQSVMDKLKLHKARGKTFERILGVPWPL